ASLAGSVSIQRWLIIAGIPLSILTAVYTAYLFAQAKARDLWQNPLLPPHLLVQSLILGSAILLPLSLVGRLTGSTPDDFFPPDFLTALVILGGASFFHLVMVLGEVSLTHSTTHARVAVWEMIHGRYKLAFWTGLLASVVGGILPWAALYGFLSFL